MHHPALGGALLVDDRAAPRRGRRGRGSPGSCRGAWRGRCAGGTTPPAPPGPPRRCGSGRARSRPRPAPGRGPAPAARSRRAPRRACRPRRSRGASLGCRATPATRASCVAAASTAHRAPGRSQPICTIRGTPTAAAAASAVLGGEPVARRPSAMSRWQWLSTTGCGSGSGAGGRSRSRRLPLLLLGRGPGAGRRGRSCPSLTPSSAAIRSSTASASRSGAWVGIQWMTPSSTTRR